MSSTEIVLPWDMIHFLCFAITESSQRSRRLDNTLWKGHWEQVWKIDDPGKVLGVPSLGVLYLVPDIGTAVSAGEGRNWCSGVGVSISVPYIGPCCSWSWAFPLSASPMNEKAPFFTRNALCLLGGNLPMLGRDRPESLRIPLWVIKKECITRQ